MSKLEEAHAELDAARLAVHAALEAWDDAIATLIATSLAFTRAQQQLNHAHALLTLAAAESFIRLP